MVNLSTIIVTEVYADGQAPLCVSTSADAVMPTFMSHVYITYMHDFPKIS